MDIPVIFGVLTTETIEQAIERAGTKAGNKGYESAVAQLKWLTYQNNGHKKVAASFYFHLFVHLLLIHSSFFLLFLYEELVLFSIHSLFFASSIIVISFLTSFKSFPSVFNPKCSAFVRKCCSILCCISFCSGFSAALTGSRTYCFY